jgi:hypothetical protein
VAQPESGLETDQTSLERPENSCAATLPSNLTELERICREVSYPRRLEAIIAAKCALTK